MMDYDDNTCNSRTAQNRGKHIHSLHALATKFPLQMSPISHTYINFHTAVLHNHYTTYVPLKVPLPMGDLDLHSIMVPWAHPMSTPQMVHLNRFSHFCTVVFNKETQTDHATPSVATSRVYLVLQCGLIIRNN